ncbi:M48 family metallopeptidase [Gloeobacter morelensis]|uniref:M48 family metallopeptidase n=1 Tax=Gloeobacter morelensis MG652769 TaxID=2781736 RepID=A0ABY3PR52_9CYAN|nr:M48 family metallopeptidase [Gloeobacter morelensis]UFP96085.1 M48 family metallopeptidase [Gloeobacter morelensis MG652769]
MSRKHFSGLHPDSFRHPLDTQATRSLAALPGLDWLIRYGLAPAAGRLFYLENISASIRVGEKQLPHLHALLREACAVLDIAEPQLYIKQHPVPNAYTFAVPDERAFIVVHTSLLELLTDAEIQAVIAHELGHLKCDHGVYLTLANLFVLATAQIPQYGPLLAQPLRQAMLGWLRAAEFSCDRAALLVTQDVQVLVSLMMKLCGGSPSLVHKLDAEAFLEQARAYEAVDEDELSLALKIAATAEKSHPVPVLRAREIDRWTRSENYRRLMGGEHYRPLERETPRAAAAG